MNTSGKPAAPPPTAPESRRLEAFPADAPPLHAPATAIDGDEVLDAIGDAILVFDSGTGRVLKANAAACRLFGYSAAELQRLDIASLAAGDPPHSPRDLERWTGSAQAEGPQLFEWLVRTRDGGCVWVDAALNAVGHEPASGRAYLTLRDISRRKALAADRERADAETRRNEERFRLLLGRMPTVAVQSLGPDGLVRYWNETSERLYGYTAAEALGRSLFALVVPVALQAEMRIALHQMVASGQPLAPAEVQLVRKDGRFVSVLSSHAVLNLPGVGPEIYRLDFDLSERKQAEAERLDLERRLSHAQNSESLGVLAGGIAHDFNNLLTGVLGNLELARAELAAESPVRPLLDDAIAASRRASRLTQQLLAYAGHERPRHRSIDLSTIVEEHAATLATLTAGRATVQFDLARDLPAAEADPAHIAQVLVNLVTNAAEAIGTAVGTVEVRTGLEEHCTAERLSASRLVEKPPPQPFVFLEVADTGCGMPAALEKRAFDPFFSTKFTGRGRGLGLPVVFGIVRAHRGALFIDSRAGRGCVVRVLLPLARTPAGTPPEPLPDAPLTGTLLVIDDEESTRRIARRMGQRLGLDVIEAIDAQSAAALGRLHAGGMVCAVIDHTMPDGNGFDCLQLLREIQPGIPAVLCSGGLPPELTDDAKLAGFDWILPKPFSFEQFAEALQIVGRRAASSGYA